MIPAIKAGKNWDQCQKLESVDRKKERKKREEKKTTMHKAMIQ